LRHAARLNLCKYSRPCPAVKGRCKHVNFINLSSYTAIVGVVAVRGLDEELYRRVKAVAALRGIRVRDAFEEALRLWLGIKPEVLRELEDIEREAEPNRRAFEEARERLLAEHEGRYAAFAGGRLLGVFDNLEEAAKAVEASGARHGVIERLVRKVGKREVELGWSLVEL